MDDNVLVCEFCDPVLRVLEKIKKRFVSCESRGHVSGLSKEDLRSRRKSVLNEYKLLRKRLRHRNDQKKLKLAFTENDDVTVSDRMGSTLKTLVLSEAAKKTIGELREQGGVSNLYLADALENRVRSVQGRRWTPQVLAFCSYFLSVIGRKGYQVFSSNLIGPYINTLLK